MRKAKRGESLDLSARDWNRLCDVAGQKLGATPGAGSKKPLNCVWVKNTLGRDLARYAAVCIGSPVLIEPTTEQIDPVFALSNGSLQAQEAYGQADPIIGILPEPIAQDRIGLAQIFGLTPASVINTEGNSNNTNNIIPEYASISDDKDMLAFAQFGPVRVLQRNIAATAGNTGTGKYILVSLGEAPHVGSCEIWYTTTWTSTPNESRDWSLAYGDLMRMGVHGEAEAVGSILPAGKLYLSRTGRYLVVSEWYFAPASAVTLGGKDRLEWRANWGVNNVEYGGFAGSNWGSNIGTLGGLAVTAIRGERTFHMNVLGSGAEYELPTPGLEALKIPDIGSTTSVSVNGGGRLQIIRLGAVGESSGGPWTSFWTKAKRDASWARGATAGPI